MRHWGLPLGVAEQTPGDRAPMRCSYDAIRLSDNLRQIECWFSQIQIEFGRVLDRDVARFRPAQNLIDILSRPPEPVREVSSLGHHTSRFHVFTKGVHYRFATRAAAAKRRDVSTHVPKLL